MKNWQSIALAILFLLIASFLVTNLSLHKPLDHDENQFIASAVLFGDLGLLPYRDFAYFHMPYLIFIYAPLFRLSDHLLLLARLFSSASSIALLLMMFVIVYRIFAKHTPLSRLLLAGAAVAALMANPLYIHTTGLSWNHDFPVLLVVIAFWLFRHSLIAGGKSRTALVAGLALALATGIRLSFAPLWAGFLLLPLLLWEALGRKLVINRILYLSAGLLAGILPALFFLVVSPKAFLFGNFGYPGLNSLYRDALGYTRAMDLIGKLLYSLEILVHPGTLVVLICFVWFALRPGIFATAAARRSHLEAVFAALLLPFFAVGVFAATPSFPQYFYAPMPILILATFCAIRASEERRQRGISAAAIALLLTLFISLPSYPSMEDLFAPKSWVPQQIHRQGREIAALCSAQQKVLTLAPILALEGGRSIYPEFVTGPFAWRTAQFISAEERRAYGLIAPQDLSDFLEGSPPGLILTGFEWRDEVPLDEYARRMNYKKVPRKDQLRVWLAD